MNEQNSNDSLDETENDDKKLDDSDGLSEIEFDSYCSLEKSPVLSASTSPPMSQHKVSASLSTYPQLSTAKSSHTYSQNKINANAVAAREAITITQQMPQDRRSSKASKEAIEQPNFLGRKATDIQESVNQMVKRDGGFKILKLNKKPGDSEELSDIEYDSYHSPEKSLELSASTNQPTSHCNIAANLSTDPLLYTPKSRHTLSLNQMDANALIAREAITITQQLHQGQRNSNSKASLEAMNTSIFEVRKAADKKQSVNQMVKRDGGFKMIKLDKKLDNPAVLGDSSDYSYEITQPYSIKELNYYPLFQETNGLYDNKENKATKVIKKREINEGESAKVIFF